MDVSSFYYAESSDNNMKVTVQGRELQLRTVLPVHETDSSLYLTYRNIIHWSGVLLQWKYDFLLSEFFWQYIIYFWIMDGQ